ncbi:uncharacterized protein MAM_06699 [Metarhizium album ARSEF 1941]|uniref:Urease accessory protein UreD n=1 Tax=Metarhizium album (strain ARSEF 1941) TaxID=1081103 RepID=A0A0B2WPL9_METAS|nr:uncharacterized protein MAM_06699 [Metarhizium album ARSEF 1941]KHN95422.1 hypothetical protein MAM_06699 [Metarhizium album ARSEF 1941]
MPHKHKRKRGEDDDFDLPPSQKALPLPVSTSRQNGKRMGDQAKQKPRRKDRKSDDGPRAFKRIMAFAQGKKSKPGLYNGESSRSRPQNPGNPAQIPRIKPGEDMRSFSARVDAALPVAGLTKKTKTKDGKDLLGINVKRTRKERKMHKLYDQWRAEESKIQQQKEEELELAASRELENDYDDLFTDSKWADTSELRASKKSRKRKGKEPEEDPWLELARKRGEARIGLNDVAQGPPELFNGKLRKKVELGSATVDVDSIPKIAGSLRRREELQTARNDVIEAYRKIREHEQAKLEAQRGKSRR